MGVDFDIMLVVFCIGNYCNIKKYFSFYGFKPNIKN